MSMKVNNKLKLEYYVNSDGSIPKVNQCNKCGNSNTMKLDRNRSDAVLY